MKKTLKITAAVLSFAFIAGTGVFSAPGTGYTQLFENAIVAEATDGTGTPYENNLIYYNGILYEVNKSTKEAAVSGKAAHNLSGGTVTLGTVNIPTQIVVKSGTYKGTYKVTSIKDSAFRNTELTTLNLKDCTYLKKIGSRAFEHCTSLKTVTLNSSLSSLGGSTFKDCTKLSSVNFSGNSTMTKIAGNAFRNCTALSYISIPYSVREIYSNAFNGSGLKSITISNHVDTIHINAFSNCASLTTVKFEAADETNSLDLLLLSHAFSNCKKITSVHFDRLGISAAADTFEGCGDTFKSHGYGAQNYTQSVAKKLLQEWGLTYKSSGSYAVKEAFFNQLKHKIHEYITYQPLPRATDSRNFEDGCAATVLSIRKGTCGGFARVFYNFCIAAGVSDKEVLVGGNSLDHAWNYVKIDGKWYNVDATGDYDVCNAVTFQTHQPGDPVINDILGENRHPHQPSGWTVCLDDNLGSDDTKFFSNPRVILFDSLLKYNYGFTGTRA